MTVQKSEDPKIYLEVFWITIFSSKLSLKEVNNFMMHTNFNSLTFTNGKIQEKELVKINIL